MRVLAGLLILLLTASCAAASDPLRSILRDPEAHNGALVSLVVYPYDLGNSGSSVRVCLDPCDFEGAGESLIGVRFLDRASFAGMQGQTSVALTARFSDECFRGLLCDGTTFWFNEVP